MLCFRESNGILIIRQSVNLINQLLKKNPVFFKIAILELSKPFDIPCHPDH